jgi:hypothetical protein
MFLFAEDQPVLRISSLLDQNFHLQERRKKILGLQQRNPYLPRILVLSFVLVIGISEFASHFPDEKYPEIQSL